MTAATKPMHLKGSTALLPLEGTLEEDLLVHLRDILEELLPLGGILGELLPLEGILGELLPPEGIDTDAKGWSMKLDWCK